MSGALQEKVAIVTGGARGIGRAVALALAREGAKLALCSRTAEELKAAAAELERLGAQVMARPADVSQPDHVAAFVDETVGRFGRLDVLVNNAGVGHPHVPLLELSVEEWDRVLSINLRGAYLMARASIPHMVRQREGSVINVSSWLGRDALTGYGAYGVSKWGMEGITRYLALELKPFGVRVNSVHPGYVATKMTNYGGAKPESVVDLFVYLASDASRGISGQALDVETWRQELQTHRK
ncbi:MAG: SDR family NAD(P)-dependent oxidoreductase [Candidatus Methylomirabilia bacterium]